MASSPIVSKIYLAPNNALAGSPQLLTASGCSRSWRYTGTEAQITATTTITITNAPAGTYNAIDVTLGSRAVFVVNYLGTTPTVFHISAKSGSDSSMTLTTMETAAGTDTTNRTWVFGGTCNSFATANQAAKSFENTPTGFYGADKVWMTNEGGAAFAPTALSQVSLATNGGGIRRGPIVYEGFTTTEGDGGLFVVQSADGAFDHLYVNVSHLWFRNLSIAGFTGAFNGITIAAAGTYALFDNVLVGLPGSLSWTGYAANVAGSGAHFVNCLFDGGGKGSTTLGGLYLAVSTGMSRFVGCTIRNFAGYGIYPNSGSHGGVFQRCLVALNGLSGVYGYGTNCALIDCTIDGNSQSGIYFNSTSYGGGFLVLNTIFSNNGRYGIERGVGAHPLIRGCDFYGNSLGDQLDCNFPIDGVENFALDPQYVNRAAGDYRIGANLRQKAYPAALPAGYTSPVFVANDYRDIGALQRLEGGGGGGLSKSRLLCGV